MKIFQTEILFGDAKYVKYSGLARLCLRAESACEMVRLGGLERLKEVAGQEMFEDDETVKLAVVAAQKEKQEARGMVVEHRVSLKILHRNETLKLLLRCRR